LAVGVRPTLVRKVNADDKRQAAELIELDGGDLRREPLAARKTTLASLARRALACSSTTTVGFISLFGVSAMDGILLVSYIRRGIEEGRGSENAIIHAGEARMRQIFMTGFSACIGLVPAAVSTGIGSQVQQPLACVIVGGMLLSPFCSLYSRSQHSPASLCLWFPGPAMARRVMRHCTSRAKGSGAGSSPHRDVSTVSRH